MGYMCTLPIANLSHDYFQKCNCDATKCKQTGVIERKCILMCLSLYQNTGILLSYKLKIVCLNALRSISLFISTT